MIRRSLLVCAASSILLLASCQRAEQYKARIEKAAAKQDHDDVPPSWAWMEPERTPRDTPIVFVPSTNADWPRLKAFWNEHAAPIGQPTLHFGLAPLEIAAVWASVDDPLPVKIKVPSGLPDPTPLIPPDNPPSVNKWRLGKKLFFEGLLPVGADLKSCAECHDPGHGFAHPPQAATGTPRTTLGLINVAYNHRQFWDGRVQTLEETIVRSLDDERIMDHARSKERALQQHVWGGFVRTLVKLRFYESEFDSAFGIKHATQDAVAKALATYMRTILSGDSVYDRAEAIRRAKKADALSAEHFREALKDADLGAWQDEDGKSIRSAELPDRLMRGYELFRGKAGCAQCHSGPLFTDQDYHNIGLPRPERDQGRAEDLGRENHAPIGHKDLRLEGAFRTPSLRNLPRKGQYTRGEYSSLFRVVHFYDTGVKNSVSLAKALKIGDRPRRLYLSEESRDANALVQFLRALDGTRVDPIVRMPPK